MSESSPLPLIVLDRDGVINRDSDAFIKTPDEWIALPGSIEALADLHACGYTTVVASNQSGVGRGLLTLAMLDAIHDKMTASVGAAGGHIDAVYFCPHAPDVGCDCRKPKPGLLERIGADYRRPAHELLVVGDSLRDLEAAWAIGAPAALVRTGNGRQTEARLPAERAVPVFDDLVAFVADLTG